MASNNQSDTNEIKRRFDIFHREARFQEKPFRLLGRPQITNKQMSVVFAYPDSGDKTSFTDEVAKALKEYGLDPAEPMRQKSGVRIQARLLAIEANEKDSEADEA